MSFIKEKQSESSIYLTLNKEPQVIRPLQPRPISYWQHWIAKVLIDRNGKLETIRNGGSEPCTEKADCTLCNTPDPYWDQLPPKDKYSQRGNRQDFSRSLRHGLLVWDYKNQTPKIMPGGNQLFENLDEAEDAGINITAWDWAVWKDQENNQNKYHAERTEQTQFVGQYTQEQMDAIIQQFTKNDVTCDTSENLVHRIGASTGPTGQQQIGQPVGQQQAFGQAQHVSPDIGAPPPIQPQGVQPQPGQLPAVNPNPTMPAYQQPPLQQQPTQPMPGQPFAGQGMQPQETFQPPITPQPITQPAQPLPPTPTPSPQPAAQPPQQSLPLQPTEDVPGAMSQKDIDMVLTIPSGKHKGKTLGFLIDNDPAYFNGLGSFMKNYPEIVAARDRLQGGDYPAIVSPPSAAIQPQVQQAPLAPPVQTLPQPGQPAVQINENGQAERNTIEAQVTALFMSRKDLWVGGNGLAQMTQFIEAQIGTAAYNSADAAQLLQLKSALEQHHLQNPIQP